MVGLPGRSHHGPRPELTGEQRRLRDRLIAHVDALAGTIGERHVYRPGSLEPYRYPHYHRSSDTPDKLDYDSLARVVMGLSQMFAALGPT